MSPPTSAARWWANAKTAESGGTMENKPKAKRGRPPGKKAETGQRKKQPAKKRAGKNLPPSVDPKLKMPNLLEMGNRQAPDPPKESSIPSFDSSTSEGPLSAEAERLLAGIPDQIGDAPLGDPVDGSESGEVDPVAELMAQVAFEPQDVQDTLCEMFDWLGERFESDHWSLTERQARMLGRPSAQLLNALWLKLQVILPDILARWCEQTPGATAFILACGIVVVPKVTTQISISRERAREKKKKQTMVGKAPAAPGPVPAPPVPPTDGLIYKEGK